MGCSVRNGKFGHNDVRSLCVRVTKSRLYDSWVRYPVIVHLHVGLNVSSSAHNFGCVIDGLWQQFYHYYYYHYYYYYYYYHHLVMGLKST